MSPPASALACLSSNQAPTALPPVAELSAFSPKPLRSSGPRKATFMTCPPAVATAACTRQRFERGSAIRPRILFLDGSAASRKAIRSQPALETSRLPHLPPPVLGSSSVSIAIARTVAEPGRRPASWALTCSFFPFGLSESRIRSAVPSWPLGYFWSPAVGERDPIGGRQHRAGVGPVIVEDVVVVDDRAPAQVHRAGDPRMGLDARPLRGPAALRRSLGGAGDARERPAQRRCRDQRRDRAASRPRAHLHSHPPAARSVRPNRSGPLSPFAPVHGAVWAAHTQGRWE